MPRPTAGVLWYARHEAWRAERVFRRSAAHVAPDDSPGRWPGLHSNDQRERQIPHHEERQSSQAQRKIQQQEDSGKGRHGHNSGFSRRFHPVQPGDQRRKIARRAIAGKMNAIANTAAISIARVRLVTINKPLISRRRGAASPPGKNSRSSAAATARPYFE